MNREFQKNLLMIQQRNEIGKDSIQLLINSSVTAVAEKGRSENRGAKQKELTLNVTPVKLSLIPPIKCRKQAYFSG